MQVSAAPGFAIEPQVSRSTMARHEWRLTKFGGLSGLIRVSGLAVYPVKSCRGIVLEEAVVGATGFDLDRQWMVVDAGGRFLSQREAPELAHIEVAVGGGELTLNAPALPALTVPLEGPYGRERTVAVWQDRCAAVDAGDSAARWLEEHLGRRARLVRMAGAGSRPMIGAAVPGTAVSFADAFPFLLVSEASLDELNRRLETPVPMNRFRPNIVVAGCAPHAEDGWRRVSIGEVVFRVAKPCARCVITTTDQRTGERGPEPLRTLASYRTVGGKVLFGQNLVHEGRGVVRVGDRVRVVPGS